ncbi:MAG: ATP synthase F0 subunit C [Spirochaetota bacterium]|nr:ATP synthase F0 subunit C [Spirochaetota bacterium]
MSELSLMAALIGGGLAIIGVGLGLGLIGFSAISGIARQPMKSKSIKRNMAVLAIIIIALSFIPLSISLSTVGFTQNDTPAANATTHKVHAPNDNNNENHSGYIIGVGLVIIAAAGAIAFVGHATMNTIGKLPDKAGDIRMTMIVLVALIEGLALFGMVIILLLGMGLKM